jgi:hypothetical protein
VDCFEDLRAAHRRAELDARVADGAHRVGRANHVPDAKRPVRGERPSLGARGARVVERGGGYEVARAGGRDRSLGSEADHAAQRVGGAVALVAARFPVVPRVLRCDGPLGEDFDVQHRGRIAGVVQFQIDEPLHVGPGDGRAEHQLELGVGPQELGVLSRRGGRSGEYARPAHAEREQVGLFEAAAVHRREAVGDGHGVAGSGGERCVRREAQGDRVAPLETSGHRRGDREDRLRVYGSIQTTGDGAVEGDRHDGGRLGLVGRRGA